MNTTSLSRQIFVAYSYSIYDKRDYRRVFSDLEKDYDIKFIFADEKITNMHIMQKIISYIKTSDFSLFDISGWNPNVTLELGYAMCHSDKWYIAFNPDKTNLDEVPSDLKGIDRLQYRSFAEFSDKLIALLEQHYPRQQRKSLDEFLKQIEGDIVRLIENQPGIKMNEIADTLSINVRMAQSVVTPLLDRHAIRVEGVRRGAKYFRV